MKPAHEIKGYRRFFGGPMDGQVDKLIYAHHSDYPQTITTGKRDGKRAMYARDLDGGTDVTYRFVGWR